jgi:hypothetical protein
VAHIHRAKLPNLSWTIISEFVFVMDVQDVRFDVYPAVTMKNVLIWDIRNPVCISQETHYVSATQPTGLMLWKI